MLCINFRLTYDGIKRGSSLMHKINALAKPLPLVGLLLLLLPSSLGAATACTDSKSAAETSTSQQGKVIRDEENLSAELRRAQGGETFLLASGNYGTLSLSEAFPTPITLRSASPDAPACFTDLRLNGAKNIHLDGLVFDYVYTAGDREFTNSFSIQGSDGIKISNSIFDGGYKNGVGHGRGLNIRNSSSIDIRNNVFRKWWKALTGDNDRNLTIHGNEFYDIRSDGMAIGASNGLIIQANHMHNFRALKGAKDHRDMVQILRSTNRRSTDMVIRDNIFDMGGGDSAQTIWMGGDGKDLADPMLRHRNILIENNIIYNAHLHGISVHGIDNLSIRKNSVIRVRRVKSGDVTVPKITVSPDSTSVVIEQNATAAIGGYKNQRDWAVLNNAIIQDTSPSSPGFYDQQFVYYATGRANGYNEYGVRPDSMIDRLNAGSTLSNNYPTRR